MGPLIGMGECYANSCILALLIDALSSGHGPHDTKRVHGESLGRDKVVKKAHRLMRWINDYVIVVIDYERGDSRKYIDHNFSLTEVCPRILVGRSVRDPRVLAVVLDPDFEYGLLCADEGSRELCEEHGSIKLIKSAKACAYLSEFLREFVRGECFQRIVEALKKMLSGSGD